MTSRIAMRDQKMELGDEEDTEDLYLETFTPHKIAAYRETAQGLAESGKEEEARELYGKAIAEIDEHRDNIDAIRANASLSAKDTRTLRDIEENLDELEIALRNELANHNFS